MKQVNAQFKEKGRRYRLNVKEHKILLALIAKSPEPVPVDELQRAANINNSHLRTLLCTLRKSVMIEGGNIQMVKTGYRIISVGKFP